MASQVNSNNLEETIPVFYTFFQNIEERTLSNSFYETITLLSKPDITGKLMSNIFHDHRHKKSLVIVVQIQQFIKRIINHEQLGLISEMQSIFNIGKSLMHFTTSPHQQTEK